MAERNGWHQVITVFPASLTTAAYRHESGEWWVPDPEFNEASLVGANITPLYTQAEVDEMVERAAHDAAITEKVLEDAAARLDREGVVWHGDRGVMIREDPTWREPAVPLVEWLRTLTTTPTERSTE